MTVTLVGTPDPEPRKVLVLGVNEVTTSNSSEGTVVIEPVADRLSSFTSVGWRWSGC